MWEKGREKLDMNARLWDVKGLGPQKSSLLGGEVFQASRCFGTSTGGKPKKLLYKRVPDVPLTDLSLQNIDSSDLETLAKEVASRVKLPDEGHHVLDLSANDLWLHDAGALSDILDANSRLDMVLAFNGFGVDDVRLMARQDVDCKRVLKYVIRGRVTFGVWSPPPAPLSGGITPSTGQRMELLAKQLSDTLAWQTHKSFAAEPKAAYAMAQQLRDAGWTVAAVSGYEDQGIVPLFLVSDTGKTMLSFDGAVLADSPTGVRKLFLCEVKHYLKIADIHRTLNLTKQYQQRLKDLQSATPAADMPLAYEANNALLRVLLAHGLLPQNVQAFVGGTRLAPGVVKAAAEHGVPLVAPNGSRYGVQVKEEETEEEKAEQIE